MSKKNKETLENEELLNGDATLNGETIQEEEQPQEEQPQEESEESKVESLEARVADLEDKNLRMMAEFDNYRRRTNKEKLELMATAGERIFKEMLPLVDDFERATEAMQKTDDIDAVRE